MKHIPFGPKNPDDYWLNHCRVCRGPIEQPATGRKRITCGGACRKAMSRRYPAALDQQRADDRRVRQEAERTLAAWEAQFGPYDDVAPVGGLSERTRLRMYLMRGAPINYCRRCHKPTLKMDAVGYTDEGWGREDQGFCSETCARAYHEHARAVYKAVVAFEGDYDPVVDVRLRLAGAEGIGLCGHCGRPFPDYGMGRKYCDKGCRQAAWRARRRKCPECGRWFSPKAANQIYCGKGCSSRVHKRTKRRRRRQRAYRPRRRCRACGKVLERSKYHGKRHKYCTKACASRAGYEKQRKEYPERGVCVECGETFPWTKHAAGRQLYCTKDCKREAKNRRRRERYAEKVAGATGEMEKKGVL